jgi:hypothetical protein
VDLSDSVAVTLFCAEALRQTEARFAAHGGLALEVSGEPREPGDVDVAAVELTVDRLCEVLTASGMSCLGLFDDLHHGGLRIGRIRLLGGEGHFGLNTVDLVRPRSARYGEAVLGRATLRQIRGQAIPVVSAEDFVILKTLATRERDFEDAATVLRRYGPALDRDLIQREVDALSLEIVGCEAALHWTTVQAREHIDPRTRRRRNKGE